MTIWQVRGGVRDLGSLAADRSLGHRMLMSRLVPVALEAAHPRQSAGLLWALEADSSGVRLLVRSQVRLQDTGPAAVELAQADDLHSGGFTAGQELDLRVELERTYVPFVAPPEGYVEAGFRTRGVRVAVPAADEEHLDRWLVAKLACAGVEAIGEPEMVCFIGRVGDRAVPGLDVGARVRVTDPAALEEASTKGLGRGKNYGFGLLRLREPVAQVMADSVTSG